MLQNNNQLKWKKKRSYQGTYFIAKNMFSFFIFSWFGKFYVTGRGGQQQKRKRIQGFSKAIYLKPNSISKYSKNKTKNKNEQELLKD